MKMLFIFLILACLVSGQEMRVQIQQNDDIEYEALSKTPNIGIMYSPNGEIYESIYYGDGLVTETLIGYTVEGISNRLLDLLSGYEKECSTPKKVKIYFDYPPPYPDSTFYALLKRESKIQQKNIISFSVWCSDSSERKEYYDIKNEKAWFFENKTVKPTLTGFIEYLRRGK
jgi:hypothetical protein